MSGKIHFPTAGENHPYAGMPLFDGVPAHFDAYLEALLEYGGLEAAVLWANEYRHDYTLQTGSHAGARIPGTLLWGPDTDSVQGYKTDFPCMMGLGQSWNRELVYRAGEVLGREYINQTDFSCGDSGKFSAMICTAMQDMRVNPLSGRFDEGFSEDPMLASEMVDAMARGVAGTDAPENPEGFWERSCVVTKHFTTYGGQTFRMAQSNDISMRGLMEHQVKAPVKGVASGAVSGFMMSFGRTNGVPNTLSPAVSYLQSLSPYGLYSTPDIYGTSLFWDRGTYSGDTGVFSNGYDKSYIAPEYQRTASAIMAHAECGGYAMEPENVNEAVMELVNIARAGVYEVDTDEIRRQAKNNLAAFVRTGFLNARREDYPFLAQAAETADEHTPKHQRIALEAARESIVLLKNNGILPLKGNKRIAVAGFVADARFKTVYAARNLPRMEHCGMTVKEAVGMYTGERGGSMVFHSDGRTVRIRCGGRYLTVTDRNRESEEYGRIGFTDDPGQAEVFELYSWGQGGGCSLRSVRDGMWFSTNNVQENFMAPLVPTRLRVNQELDLISKDTTLTAIFASSTLPSRMRIEEEEDGSFCMVIQGYSESLLQTSPAAYYLQGRLVVSDGDTLHFTEPLKNPEHAAELRKTAARFRFETVKEAGAETAANGNADIAVVVVGVATRHSAGEGVDRSDLYLGSGQYELVKTVAAAHPGRTVVVVNASYPVILEEIETNPDVAAIVYQPYAGQYDGLAMGQVLFGDYAPTGRLTATWYADMNGLPKLDAYSVPEGPSVDFKPFEMDPRLTCDLRRQDLISEKLTYQYTDAKVTYPMGYGLGYSEFAYSDLHVEPWTDTEKPWSMTVRVKNTGTVKTSEVVQLYLRNIDSAYGAYAPKKVLAAFEKVELEPDEERLVTLTVKPQDAAVWDVNGDRYIVEEGTYQVMVGRSSGDIRIEKKVRVSGEPLAVLDPARAFNLFAKSYAAESVTYREQGKRNTMEKLKNQHGLDGIGAGYFSVMSKKAGAWTAVKHVCLEGLSRIELTAAACHAADARHAADACHATDACHVTDALHAAGGTDPSESGAGQNEVFVRLDAPDGEEIAKLCFCDTEPAEYQIPNTGAQPDLYPEMTVRELGYTKAEAVFGKAFSGVHDLYFVFGGKDIRIADVKMS